MERHPVEGRKPEHSPPSRGPAESERAPAARMPAERVPTYSVVSNPVSIEHGDLNVLFSGESQTRPGHRIGPKVYDFWLLHHVLSGTGVYRVEGTEYRLRAGHAFLIAPGRLIEYAADERDPWRYRWVAFAGSQSEALAASAGFTAARPVADAGRSLRPAALIGRIQRAFREGGKLAHLEAAGCLSLLMVEYGKAQAREDAPVPGPGAGGNELVQRIVHYLSTQYAEPVSIELMAATLGFSRAYLSRVFKRHTGMTPVEFLLRLRIDHARRLLRERRELTVEQIAASVGFQDPLYFSKQFRRICGMPPTAYRESMLRLGAPWRGD
jgi:AraC-like DNA-binding protein